MTRTLVSYGTKQRVFRALARRPSMPRSAGVAILCYHSLDPSNPRRSVTPERFEQHVRWLSDRCDLVSLSDAAPGKEAGSRPTVAITFDDGFADQHEHALPVLRNHRAPATFFITTGRMEPDLVRDAPGLRALESEGPGMSWEQVRDLVDAGMEIGAHTHRHPNLASLDDAAAADEMVTSRDLLHERLGADVTSFAYPFGRPRRHHTEATRRLAAEAGFDRAVAVLYRRVTAGTDPYCIPRFAIQNDDLAMLEAKVDGRMDIVGRWQANGPLWAVRTVAGRHI